MDCLTFKFCVLIWALCVSNSQSESINSTISNINIISTELRTACIEGQPVAPPDQCNTCICFAGLIYCTHLSCVEQECDGDGELAKPDPCNKCVCRRGKVTCSDRICIPAPNCAENELFPAHNECNSCSCVNGYISCTTNSCDKEHTSHITTSRPKKKRKCVEGTRIVGPNDCIECICRDGRKRCKFICNKHNLESRFKDAECVSGQHIPRPDECNNCICFEGQIHCTHMPCPRDTRIGLECTDDQPVFRPDECNECYCFEGKLECSDLVCIRGSKCVEGEVIPKPDGCNACKCVEGHILCTDYQCLIPVSRNTLSPEVQPLVECQEGDVIPPPLPPNDCNTCICVDNTITCSTETCVVSVPGLSEITGRLGEQKEQTDLKVFDKEISMEPFISMLSKHDKSPTKLIHKHTYNGFHQEIKVHSSNLPKDATQFIRVLATSLDNPVLASISQKLSSSANDGRDQTNGTSKEKLVAQSSKVISGSRSNETILVIPNTELLVDNQNSQSVLPVITKHETTWKSVSAPAPLVSTNDVTYQHDPKGKPAQFGHPGLSNFSPPQPTPIIAEIQNIKTQSIFQTLKPTLINNNDDKKISYTPFPQESKPFKHPQPYPYRPTQPVHNIFNSSSPHPLHKPGNFIATPNNNGGQQKPSQSQFVPNLSTFYPNQAKPPQFQLKPTLNLLPTLNNKGILRPPLYPNKPNLQPIASGNQYKPPALQLGFKSRQGSIEPLNNKDNLSDQLFKSKHPQNLQINPALHNVSAQQTSISYTGFDNSNEVPSFSSFESNSTIILIIPQNEENSDPTQHISLHSQFNPNSSSKKHEYELPEVNGPDVEQLQPTSITIYTEHHDTVPSLLNKTNKNGDEPTHSHYTQHTKITYISEHDSLEQSDPSQDQYKKGDFKDNGSAEGLLFLSNLADDPAHPTGFQHLPQSISEPTQNQHTPGVFQDGRSKNRFKHPHNIYEDPRQLKPFKIEPPQNKYLQGAFDDPVSTNSPQYLSNSAGDILHPQLEQHKPNFDPAHLKENLHEPPNSPFAVSQNQLQPGVLDNREVNDRFKYSHYADEIPIHFKPVHKLPQSSFGPTLIQNTTGMFNEPGSADAFQYTPNSTENPVFTTGNKHNLSRTELGPFESQHLPGLLNTRLHSRFSSLFDSSQNQHTPEQLDDSESVDGFHLSSSPDKNRGQPKISLHNSPHSQLSPTQNQHLPGLFDDATSADSSHYPSDSAGDRTLSKGKPNNSPFGSTQNQPASHSPRLFESRASFDHFSYPSNSAEDPKHPRYKLPNSLFGSTQNQPASHSPDVFNERATADHFRYPFNSIKDPKHPRYKPPNSPFGSTQNQPASHSPGVSDERATADHFRYPFNSIKGPKHPSDKPPKSLFALTQNQHLPGIFNNNASPDGSHNPFDFAGGSTYPRGKPPNSPFGSTHSQPANHSPGVFDNRASADHFSYPFNSIKDPKHPGYKPPNSPFGSTQNQPASHSPRLFENRSSFDHFSYPSNSAEDPKGLSDKPPKSLFDPTQNQQLPGIFDINAFPDGFHNPSGFAGDSTHPRGKPPISPFGSIQNPIASHSPGVFEERGSADHFSYPSNSAEDSKHLSDKPPKSLFAPTQNQPGILNAPAFADGFQYPPNSAEVLTHPKLKQNAPALSQLNPTQNQRLPGVHEPASSNGSLYSPYSAVIPTHPILNQNALALSQFNPGQNQHLPGVLDDSASNNVSFYPPNSAKIPKYSKLSQHNPGLFQSGPTQSQSLPTVFVNRSISVEDPTDSKGKPSNFPLGPTQTQNLSEVYDNRECNNGPNSAESLTHPTLSQHNPGLSQFGTTQNPHLPGELDDRFNSGEDLKLSEGKQPNSPLGSFQNQDLSEAYDDRESVERYIFTSTENPASSINDSYTIPDSKFKQIPNQPKLSSLDVDIVSKENENQPENKSVLDSNNPASTKYNINPLIPSIQLSLFKEIHNISWLLPNNSNNVTSAPKPGIQLDQDQYKPTFFDHLLNGVHDIPWSDPNILNKALQYYTKMTTPPSGLQAKQDIYKPSTNEDSLLAIPNQNGSSDISDADLNQLQTEQDMSTPSSIPFLKDKHIGDLNNSISYDGDTISVYGDQLFPLYMAAKKLSKPQYMDKSESSVASTDQVNVLPFLFPGIAKILNYESSSEQDDGSSLENDEFEVLDIVKRVLDRIQQKLKKYIPAKYSSTVTKNGTDINKIFNLFSKLAPSEIKHSAAKLNIPFSSSKLKLIENIVSISEEDTITTTQSPSTDATTDSFEDGFQTASTVFKEKQQQAVQHIMLPQGAEEDVEDLVTYLKTDAEEISTDMGLEGSGASPLSFKSRFKDLSKEHKEECGDGTHWINNCHGCSCYFGQAMCFKMPDCELRPFGEPMTCKPYSHFKLSDCYTCTCSGDGVAECVAKTCKTEPSKKNTGTTDSTTPVFTDIVEDENANDILQYNSDNKELPKACPKQNSRTSFPTCERGTSWISNCNKCECDNSGRHKCIKIDNCKLDYDSYGKPSRCKPNSKFYPKKNSLPCVECTCNDEGAIDCPGSDNKSH